MQIPPLSPGWQALLSEEACKPYFDELAAFLRAERAEKTIFPPQGDVFNALSLTPLEEAKVLLLGQDPYHDEGQAHGLCFSVRPPTRPPPSLKNIFRELRDDLGLEVPEGHGELSAWARRTVVSAQTFSSRAPRAGRRRPRFQLRAWAAARSS